LNLWPVSNEKISLEYKLKRLLQGSLMAPERAHIYWNGTFSEAEKASILNVPLPGALTDVLTRLGAALPGDGVAPFLEFDQEYYLPDDILVKSDRMSMAHAVEVRPPFLDHRIVEFAATLPSDFKIRGSRQKYLLKELMKAKLPVSIVRRKKVGFDIPAHDWLRGPLRSLLVETLRSGTAEHPELFRADVVEGHLQDHLERRVNIGYHLWGLMVLLLWMKKWNVRAPKPASATQWAQAPAVGAFI